MLARSAALILLLTAAGLLVHWLATRWPELDAGPFRFSAPRNLKEIPVQGTDSLVGEYHSPLFEVHFDYGIYGMDYQVKAADMTHEPARIDAREATIITFSKEERFFTAVRFDNVEPSGMGPMKLNLWVKSKDPSGRGAALRLIHSIRFD